MLLGSRSTSRLSCHKHLASFGQIGRPSGGRGSGGTATKAVNQRRLSLDDANSPKGRFKNRRLLSCHVPLFSSSFVHGPVSPSQAQGLPTFVWERSCWRPRWLSPATPRTISS